VNRYEQEWSSFDRIQLKCSVPNFVEIHTVGDGLQIWCITKNMLNKQSREGDSLWSSSLGVGRVYVQTVQFNNFVRVNVKNMTYETYLPTYLPN